MKYCFCFASPANAKAAQVERKKIDRGIQVLARWKNEVAPTITYELRVDFDGEIRYRVKFNATLWASFTDHDTELVDEFRQALHELADARMKTEVEERRTEDDENREAAATFFRAEIPDDFGGTRLVAS